MKRAAVLVMSLVVMAGSWQGAGAQAAAKPGKSNAASRPSSTRAAASDPAGAGSGRDRRGPPGRGGIAE